MHGKFQAWIGLCSESGEEITFEPTLLRSSQLDCVFLIHVDTQPEKLRLYRLKKVKVEAIGFGSPVEKSS